MSNKAAQLDQSCRGGTVIKVKGVGWFSLKELEKYTNHFSVANEIGSGGYGKVSFELKPSLHRFFFSPFNGNQLPSRKRT